MRVRVSHLKDRKQRRERFAVLTAYDATTLEPVEGSTVTLGTNVGYMRSGFGSLWYGIADNLYRLPLEALSTE